MRSPLRSLRKIWKHAAYAAVKNGFAQSKRVQDEMTKQGWDFKVIQHVFVGPSIAMPVTYLEIRNPEGQIVDSNNKDYQDAVQKAAAKIFLKRPPEHRPG